MDNPNATNQFQPSQAPEKTPFYQTTWFILLMMFCCCFPVGLFLMWKYKKFHIGVRIAFTSFFILLFLISFIGGIVNVVGSSKKASTAYSSAYSEDKYADSDYETTEDILAETTQAPAATTPAETAEVILEETTAAITDMTTGYYQDITPGDLLNAYEANQVAADELYKDQNLRLTGVVLEIGNDSSNRAYITFESSDTYNITTVQCYFSDSAQIEKLSSLTKGDTITVLGVCGGKFANVFLNDCIIE